MQNSFIEGCLQSLSITIAIRTSRNLVHWMKTNAGPSFHNVGEALVNYFMENRDYEQAVKIAAKLYEAKTKLKKNILESYVVAEFNLGRTIKAKEVLDRYKEQYPSSWIEVSDDSGREPASVGNSEFALVVRSLK